ncbi:dna-binding wrky domain-containing protein [Colletotrichum asianum]
MRTADPGPLRPFALLASLGYFALAGGWLDTLLVLVFSAWQNRRAVTDLLEEHVDAATLQHAVYTLPGAALALLVLALIRFGGSFLEEDDGTEAKFTTPMRPLLIPAKTTHRRTFPEKHDFAYSYLVVGIPVGWTGNYGGMVSSGIDKRSWSSWLVSWFSLLSPPSKGWFDIDPADYLERGNGHLGLRGKLDAYLTSQGADPAQYPTAYLVTAARFLGYHFNPVSFWYLYSKESELTAMILEVNNTFDERRMYFLTSDVISAGQRVEGSEKAKASSQDSLASNESTQTSAVRMTKHWPKDFHVSPFNSRKGSYSLSAVDFFSTGPHGLPNLDTTITLKSSKDHPKLIARLFSSAPAIDPATMPLSQKLTFLCSWWWVGFVTFPRIVHQAALLFFRRSLHVWFRPEPLKQSIGRNADAAERGLEPFFRDYLRHLVEKSSAALSVKYIPCGIAADLAPTEVMLSSAAQKQPKRTEELEFKVLTPAFYSRFVHYAHDLEAVCCEFQDNCTIHISRPDLLPKLILKKPTPPLKTTNLMDFIYFRAIRALRKRPERIERPLTSSATPASSTAGKDVEKIDIRDFRISSMDGFVLGGDDSAKRSAYRSLVLRTFLANRFALGSVELLGMQHFILRAGFAWILASTIAPLLVRS